MKKHIKVAALSPRISLADCDRNAELAAEALRRASALGAELAVFPELYLSGATCGDLLKNEALQSSVPSSIQKFLRLTEDLPIISFIGYPDGETSSVLISSSGKIITPDALELEGVKLAAVIGDDFENATDADIILSLAATPEIIGRAESIRHKLCAKSAELGCAIVRANAGLGESTTDHVFSGHSLIVSGGEIIAEKTPFGDPELPLVAEIEIGKESKYIENIKKECGLDPLPFIPKKESELDIALEIQAHALARRIGCTYSKKLVLGISGGLDSTLALLVAVRAAEISGLHAADVIGITMPCFGTTKRTRSNAELLCNELGVDFRCINIAASVKQHLSDIGHSGDPVGVAFENSQARERTQILMDLANMVGGLVVGTGDLSELALGWATYNGDHMSMYSVNSDIPKTLVRKIVERYAKTSANEKLSLVLRDILDTPVSPELLPAKDGEIAQKTEELLGPYEVHDFLLYHMLKHGYSPKTLYSMLNEAYGDQFSPSELKAWLTTFTRRFITQQFKRSCSPDGPKVCEVGLSPRGGWSAPSDASPAVWLREIENI